MTHRSGRPPGTKCRNMTARDVEDGQGAQMFTRQHDQFLRARRGGSRFTKNTIMARNRQAIFVGKPSVDHSSCRVVDIAHSNWTGEAHATPASYRKTPSTRSRREKEQESHIRGVKIDSGNAHHILTTTSIIAPAACTAAVQDTSQSNKHKKSQTRLGQHSPTGR
jgi:hypothetical protein